MNLQKLSIIALIATAISACGQNSAFTNTVTDTVSVEEAEKLSISTSRSVQVTAKVVAIDHKTRVVTLVENNGQSVTFTVGEEARNLGQVAVGDLVRADYLENITIEVISAENAEPSEAVLVAVDRSEEGETPAIEAIETIVDVYTIEQINIENNTFKLKNVDGLVTEFTAKNPDNLNKAAVGDLVVISLTQAFAISVEKSVEK